MEVGKEVGMEGNLGAEEVEVGMEGIQDRRIEGVVAVKDKWRETLL